MCDWAEAEKIARWEEHAALIALIDGESECMDDQVGVVLCACLQEALTHGD